MIITYDSKLAITVTKRSDEEYFVKQYSLEKYELLWEESFSGQYIKLKEVEQNTDGKKFVVAYNDDGNFYIRTFSQEAS